MGSVLPPLPGGRTVRTAEGSSSDGDGAARLWLGGWPRALSVRQVRAWGLLWGGRARGWSLALGVTGVEVSLKGALTAEDSPEEEFQSLHQESSLCGRFWGIGRT